MKQFSNTKKRSYPFPLRSVQGKKQIFFLFVDVLCIKNSKNSKITLVSSNSNQRKLGISINYRQIISLEIQTFVKKKLILDALIILS